MFRNLIGVPVNHPKHSVVQKELKRQQLKNSNIKSSKKDNINSSKKYKVDNCNSKSLVYENPHGRLKICKKENENNGIWISFLNFSFEEVCTIVFRQLKNDNVDYFHFLGNTSSITIFPNMKQVDLTNGTSFENLDDVENFYNTSSKLQYKILFNRNKLSIVTKSDYPELSVEVIIPSNTESNNVQTLMLAKTDNIYNPLKSWRSILFGDFRLFPR